MGDGVGRPERPLHVDVGDLQDHFAEFATTSLRRLPLYRHLAARVAEDPAVAGRLLLARPEVRWTTLLFAAVHDRLLAGAESADTAVDPLAAWYRSVTDRPRPVGTGADDPWPHFRRLALDDEAVAADLATRGTQTNEVGRCLTLLPALAGVQADVARPLGLVEVGTSAGLNLRLDHYGYRYHPDPGSSAGPDEETVAGDAPLVLSATWRGDRRPPLPTRPPIIGHRVGIDLAPIDVTDAAAARWLVACQWPEQFDRLDRCRRAVTLAQADPPTVRRGDLIADVAGLVTAVPADVHPVVLSTWCLAYLNDGEQRAFLAELDGVGRDRDLTLVFQEQAVEVPGLDPPPRPDGRDRPGPTALCRYDWRDGTRTRVRLADQHPHATWLEWLA